MILLLDNYDSFVHNLARFLRRQGRETSVVRSDRIGVSTIEQMHPSAIVLSPGPRKPEDAGCCLEVVRQLGETVPILGVCLGHQTIGQAFGGTIIRSEPYHGRRSTIRHDGTGLFADMPDPLSVGRYHSLAIDPDALPDCLTVTARSDDGTIMGIRHRELPIHGVQFHPESVLTTQGDRLIGNFCRIAASSEAKALL